MASLQERRDKNGKLISYSIRIYRGRDANGKQLKPFTETFEVSPSWKETTARKKAEDYASVLEQKVKDGIVSDNRQTFSEYCEYFIQLQENVAKRKHSTIVWYREQTERIYPEIGHLKMKDLRVDHLNGLYMKLLETQIKPTTAKAMIDLSAVLKEKKMTRAALTQITGLSENTVRIAVQGRNCSVNSARIISEALGLKLEKTFFVLNENKSLSGKTITGCHRFISAVLTQAVKEGLVPFNVAANATLPKVERKEVSSLQPADLPAILSALDREDMKWKVLVHLLIITGARRGEILGLKWSAVDFDRNRVHICNNVLYTPDRGVYQDAPKTESSIRWIALPADTMELLAEWKTYQAATEKENEEFCHNTEGLLFTRENGSPMCPDSVTTYLTRFSKKYGLPHINPHKFRHTMASLLIYNHADPVSVSKRLGHSQVSTTTNIYAHVIEEADRENADALASIFLKNA